ncbi:MAG: ABC transporter permease [Myxococcota bacterium]
MKALLTIAVRNLLLARRRTLLLGGALALVTALLVLLMALSQGLSDTIVRSATTLSSGHVNVGGFYKLTPRDAAPILTDREAIKDLVREHVDGLDYVIDRHRGWARLISPSETLTVGLVGVDVAQEDRLLDQLQLAPKSEYVEDGPDVVEGDPAELAEPNTALVFAAQAERLEVGVGDTLTLTTETMDGRSNTGEVRIVAVVKDVGFMSNWQIFVDRETILELYRIKPDTTGAVMVYLDDIDRSTAVMDRLREVLKAEGHKVMDHQPDPFWMKFDTVSGEDWTGQKLDLTTWEDEVSFLTWVVTAIDTISLILVAVLLVIIGVGIMNTMWIAVRERTGEIGTLRAIGMSRGRVLSMFLLEAVVLGLGATTLGGVAGGLAGAGLDAAEIHIPMDAVRAILMSDTLQLTVSPLEVTGAVLAFTALTGLSALWPALRASRMQPVTAIHHVG